MRTGFAGVSAIAATGALAALAATSIADQDAAPRPASPDRALERVDVEPVAVDAASRAASPRRRQELTYFEVPNPLEVPPKTEVAVELSKCPRRSEAVTGYFQPERQGTFLDRSRPVLSTSRMWAIGAYNSTDTPDQVTFGLVCLSRVK